MEKGTVFKNAALKILILEDSLQDKELIVEQLTKAGLQLDVTHAEVEKTYIEALKKCRFDIIISDFKLPGFDAFGALELCQEICPEVPFICVSGSIGEEKAIELLRQGAVDYVLKDRPDRFPFAVKRALDEAKEKATLLKAERELTESEARFRQVAETAQEWIWEVDSEGLYTYSSPLVATLLGYSPDELVGKKHFYDFFLPEEKEKLKLAAFEAFSKKEVFRNYDNTNIHKNGQRVVLSTSGSPIIDEKGNLKGYRGVDEDITERKRIIDELGAAKEKAEESDNLKTAFINNISHEVRTPLNGILGFGQILLETELSPKEKQEMLAHVQNSSKRLMNTITDYMDMAMIVSGTMKVHLKEFSLNQLFIELKGNAEQLFADKKITFKTEIPTESDDLTISSDSELIKKILSKLIENAIKFTQKGTIICGYGIKTDFIELFVRDTGVGIATDKLEAIFDMFRQADTSMTRGYEGSGLGLTIAKGMATMLGGNIYVASEIGKGSEFKFKLPVDKYSKSLTTKKTEITKKDSKQKPTLLIAEDDELNYLYIEAVVEKQGYNILHAVNGAEAVNYCMQNKGISIVLMDIKMPVIDGIEATRQIREFMPELPIIATTAHAQTGDEHRFLAAGMNDYVAKPFNKEKLLSIISKYIE